MASIVDDITNVNKILLILFSGNGPTTRIRDRQHRMKSGTAQKLVLNMISTTVMIKLGKVHGNMMVDMQLSNEKLVDRGTRMIMHELGVDYETANKLLLTHGSARKAVDGNKS